MNPRRGEQTSDFVEHRLQKIVRLADRRIENVARGILNSSMTLHLGRIPQLWDRLQGAVTVSRDIDLRHDGNEKLLSSVRKLRHMRPRIDDAVGLWRAPKERRDGSAPGAPPPHFGLLRGGRDIESPAPIIPEMKMKKVQPFSNP